MVHLFETVMNSTVVHNSFLERLQPIPATREVVTCVRYRCWLSHLSLPVGGILPRNCRDTDKPRS